VVRKRWNSNKGKATVEVALATSSASSVSSAVKINSTAEDTEDAEEVATTDAMD